MMLEKGEKKMSDAAAQLDETHASQKRFAEWSSIFRATVQWTQEEKADLTHES